MLQRNKESYQNLAYQSLLVKPLVPDRSICNFDRNKLTDYHKWYDSNDPKMMQGHKSLADVMVNVDDSLLIYSDI